MHFHYSFIFLIIISSSNSLPPKHSQNYDSNSVEDKNILNFDQLEEIEPRILNINFDQSDGFEPRIHNSNFEKLEEIEPRIHNLNFDQLEELEPRILNINIDQLEEFEPKSYNPNFDQLEELEQRILNPVTLMNDKYRKMSTSMMINETCMRRGGGLVNGECYQLFTGRKKFVEAREICQEMGGDLWTPDFNDHDLLNKLYRTVIKRSQQEKIIYIGAKENNGLVLDINGNDITNTYFSIVRGNTIMTDYCVSLTYEKGTMLSMFAICDTPFSFICEYPIEVESPQKFEKYSSVFLG